MSEDSINLREEDAENLDGPVEVGSGKLHEEELPLPQLIDVVNERFGTDFTEADQLFFDQIIEAAVEEESLKEAAAVNPQEKFSLLFSGMLQSLFIERMEQNEDIFGKFMNEKEFQNVVSKWISEKVYNRLREELSEKNTGQVTE
jgi:type I restriction enzyme, R subunit